MNFKQLQEADSSTYTYLLGCRETGKAVLIDPVVRDHRYCVTSASSSVRPSRHMRTPTT